SLVVNSNSVIRHIFIVEENGNILDSTDSQDINQKFHVPVNESPAMLPGDVKLDPDGERGDQKSRTVKFTIVTEAGRRDIYTVISMDRLRKVKQDGEQERFITILVLGAILILALAIFTKRLTRPITELSQAARKVTAGDLDFAVPVSGPEEINTLTTTFNEMLSGLRQRADLETQLERSDRAAMVGRLASGIAHEVRNPLNFINLSIDHLQASFAPKEETHRISYTHILTTIKDELARLNRLVSDFLSFGRPAKLKLRELDARALVEDVRDLVHAKADEQGVKIAI